MIIEPGEVSIGDIIKLAEYDPYKRIGYVKFYETLDDLLRNPFTRYVDKPLNPKRCLYTLVIEVDIRPVFRSLKEEIRAVKILYQTRTFWTASENVIIL